MKNPITRNSDLLAVVILAALFGVAQPRFDLRFSESRWLNGEQRVRVVSLDHVFESVRSIDGVDRRGDRCIFSPER
jgi:hypothetical protein